ncbi:hypothetical protein C0993_002003 [Termitomyces sp. T159_Od127]|nr:hypothetical protein C0993_002003 [Termitomyces sp. T159_Od127]
MRGKSARNTGIVSQSAGTLFLPAYGQEIYKFIQCIAQCVPEGHTVELTNPEIFILVEVYKSVCGMSVVQHYYDYQKFNMSEIANGKNGGEIRTERQVFSAGNS